MDHVSTDTKLKLAQMIRAENQENRMKMRSREQLVNYGSYGYKDTSFSEKDTNPFLGLRIRIGAAFLIFLGFLFLDYTGLKMGNVGAGEIVSWIDTGASIKFIDFIENFTYTLSE